MKQKMSTIFKAIKTYSEYYFTITAAIGVLWGGFVLYDNWRDNNKKIQADVHSIIQTQKRQTETDSILLYNQVIMERKLNEIKESADETSENLKSLSSSYVKYISNDKALSKEDFLKYMQGLSYDVKKNLLNYQQTPSTPLGPVTASK